MYSNPMSSGASAEEARWRQSFVYFKLEHEESLWLRQKKVNESVEENINASISRESRRKVSNLGQRGSIVIHNRRQNPLLYSLELLHVTFVIFYLNMPTAGYANRIYERHF